MVLPAFFFSYRNSISELGSRYTVEWLAAFNLFAVRVLFVITGGIRCLRSDDDENHAEESNCNEDLHLVLKENRIRINTWNAYAQVKKHSDKPCDKKDIRL